MPNQNTPEYLEKLLERVTENLRHVQFAPNVQMHAVPGDMFTGEASDSDERDSDDADEFDEFFGLDALRRRRAAEHSIMEPDQERNPSETHQPMAQKDLTAKFEDLGVLEGQSDQGADSDDHASAADSQSE
jgi:hypothetical protein